MGTTREPDGLEERRFRWERLAAVIGALGVVVNGAWTYLESRAQERRAAEQDRRAAELEQRVEANARAAKAMDLLPQVVALLRDDRCDSSVAAVTLLKEASNYQGVTGTADPFGLAAARAGLTMLKTRYVSRRDATPPYCDCDSLELIAALADSGRDVDLGRIAQEIGAFARTGKCARQLARASEPAQRPHVAPGPDGAPDAAVLTTPTAPYTVVLGNDTTCELARAAYEKNADALRGGLAREFDAGMLQLRKGTGRFGGYLVTTYGTFTLERALELVARLQSVPGVRPDIYWARASMFVGQPDCSPK